MDDMVSAAHGPARPQWRRLLGAVAVILFALTASAAPALAQQDDGTYGFNDTCEQLHDALEDLGVGPFNIGNGAAALCKAGNVASHPGEAWSAVKDAAWDTTFGQAVDSLVKGLGQALILSLTFWLKLPNETLADSGSLFAQVKDYLYEPQVYLLMASVIACGVRLAVAHRQAAAEEAEESFKVLMRAAATTAALSVVLVAATSASDEFSAWVINDSTGGNAQGVMESMINVSAMQGFSPGLVLILTILGILGALAQLVFAVIRQGLLIVVVGLLPLAAAWSGFGMGRQFYQKLLAWVIAFLLWKPIAAIVYMIAFTVAGQTSGPVGQMPADAASAQRTLVGIVLLCCAGILLPAIMRLASPITTTSSPSRGGGGAAVMGALAMRGGGARVATGSTDARGAGTVRTGANATGAAAAPSPSGSTMHKADRPRTVPGQAAHAGSASGRGPGGSAGPRGGGGRNAALGIAAVAAHTAGAGVRTVHQATDSAANPQGAPSTPSGGRGGSRSTVPR
ncbi:hypothetical protein [Nocardia sp. NPDC050435]|uniref:hypothetical protein n=1 Tax=Nocardia sp. NPDC050435 TaxID=3155040 RepID=UPI0033EE36F4